MNWNNSLTSLFFLAKLTKVTFKDTFMFLGIADCRLVNTYYFFAWYNDFLHLKTKCHIS